ncbi:hypothetical protein 1013_scaffold47_00059 [Bacteriophage sp.]|nr:hypothetical protein 1013_scaffold47_00059 [Bacteriophage sp.]
MGVLLSSTFYYENDFIYFCLVCFIAYTTHNSVFSVCRCNCYSNIVSHFLFKPCILGYGNNLVIHKRFRFCLVSVLLKIKAPLFCCCQYCR